MQKVLTLILILLISTSLIVSCTIDKNQSEENNVNNNSEVEQIENNKENMGENQRISETGIYIGQIDNNFIEIKVDDKPLVFMLTDETRKAIEEITHNKEIDFVYFENENEQLVLVSITMINPGGESMKTEVGTYVGQLDNFSIEIEIDGKPMAFINYDMEKLLEGIEEGDKVQVQYTENEHSQLDLKAIKKIGE